MGTQIGLPINRYTVTIQLPLGGSEEAISPESCLFRPFRRLTRGGKPIGSVTYLLLREDDNQARSVGSLCHTPAGHLSFFPGTIDKRVRECGPPGSVRDPNPFSVDHLTLFRNRGHWHATSSTREHTRALPVRQVGPGVLYWFGLSLASTEFLERTRRTNTVECECAASDISRRLQWISQALVPANVVELPDGSRTITPGHFLHFDFIYSESSTDELPSHVVMLPSEVKPTAVSPAEYDTCVVSLPRLAGRVFVLCSQHRGELPSACMATW